MATTAVNSNFVTKDIIGSCVLDVDSNGMIKLPKECGIVKSIVYDNSKFAKIEKVCPNFEFFYLSFNKNDSPNKVTVNWIIPYDYRARFSEDKLHFTQINSNKL